jgi:uncharacterized protein YacL
MEQKYQKSALVQIVPLLIQTVVGIIILLISRAVITGLEMVQDIQIPVNFTLSQLISAIILTIIMVMLVNLGVRMEPRLAHMLPDFPQSGHILKLILFLIAIGIGYGAYLPLIRPYWGDFDWAYNISFLIIFVAVLGALGYTIYKHTERLTPLLIGVFTGTRESSSIAAAAGPVCAGCGATGKVGAAFCTSCGASLSPPKAVDFNCKGCGAALMPNARFCVSCGIPVGEAGS